LLLDVVIPTVGRVAKLEKCLNSLFKSSKNTSIHLCIYFSKKCELEHFQAYFKHIPEVSLRFVDIYRVPDFWNSYLQQCEADAMCYINDDVLFFEDTIEMIFKYFQEAFPDYDGILGLHQDNILDARKVDAAFGVIGLKYADRFPKRQVFCPDYNRFFGDWELWRYAKSIGKFAFDRQVRVTHLHPCTDATLEDDTHKLVRKWLSIDKHIFKQRQSKNLLWGDSWELITKE